MAISINGDGSIGPLSATEIGYLDGVTSAVQTQINSKPTGGTGAWTAYTPVLSGTGWSIGNGSSTGSYTQIGKTVFFRGIISFGSTSTFGGSGVLEASLPVTSAASGGIDSALGHAIVYHPSTGVYFCGFRGAGSGKIVFHYPSNTSGLASYFIGNSPFAWASGDVIYFSGTYEAA